MQWPYGMTTFEYQGTDQRFNWVFNQAMSNHTTLIMKKVLDVYKGFEGLKVLVDVGRELVLLLMSSLLSVKHVGGDINGTYHASADEEKVMTRKQKVENKTHDNGNGKTNGKVGESDLIDVEFEEFCKAIEANLSIEQMVEVLVANDQDSSAQIPGNKWILNMLSGKCLEEGRSKITMVKGGRQKLHQFKLTQKKVSKGVSAASSGSASEAEAFE
ncbi:hypothetical protein Pint_07774 [Pistacia integerrima]|uniref:Uncharacterized protein n=1 Tax=Pistacia integerrima TaxID=434235 RepID=A0ACC0XTH8_9ROSI|nr:hypothetical protein Pint_07774 [Pistacia integerrima]